MPPRGVVELVVYHVNLVMGKKKFFCVANQLIQTVNIKNDKTGYYKQKIIQKLKVEIFLAWVVPPETNQMPGLKSTARDSKNTRNQKGVCPPGTQDNKRLLKKLLNYSE